jgi:mono/diheme cytochrome c family protein
MREARRIRFLSFTLAVFVAGLWMSALRPIAQGQGSFAVTSLRDGAFTSQQAERGERTFKGTCASCHTVSEHTGPNFSSKWDGSTVADVFELISTTMPDGNPGGMKAEEYADIIAFFLKETGYPQGTQELPPDVAALKKLRLEPLPQ